MSDALAFVDRDELLTIAESLAFNLAMLGLGAVVAILWYGRSIQNQLCPDGVIPGLSPCITTINQTGRPVIRFVGLGVLACLLIGGGLDYYIEEVRD